MKKFITLLMFIFLSIGSVSAHEQCASDVFEQSITKSYPNYALDRIREENFTTNYRNRSSFRMLNFNCQPTAALYTIPMVVHIVHKGEPIGTGSNLTDAQVQAKVDEMNLYLAMLGVKVVLAKQDPNGNATTGIVRVNGTVVPNYGTLGIDPSTNPTGAPDTAIKKLSIWSWVDYVNVWFVDQITIGGAYSSMPSSYKFQGLVIQSSAITSVSGSKTFAHEMGHYLGLLHTFQGSSGSTCALNSDPFNQGDKCFDTPPVLQSDCSSGSCGVFANILNSLLNVMGYCWTANMIFTPDQQTRVMAALHGQFRWSLVGSRGLTPAVGSVTEVSLDSLFFQQDLNQALCNRLLTSVIDVRNHGTVRIDSMLIRVQSGSFDTLVWVYTALLRGSVQPITLPSMVIPVSGSYNVHISIVRINRSDSDYNSFNNELCVDVSLIVQTVNISTTMNTPGAGTVTGSGSFSCNNALDTIKVVMNPGNIFQSIKEGNTTVSNSPTFVVPIDLSRGDRTFTVYSTIQTLSVSATANPSNGGTVPGTMIVNYGALKTLSVHTKIGYDFLNWTENGDIISLDSNLTVTVIANRNLTANFVKKRFQITVVSTDASKGSVTGTGSYAYDTIGKAVAHATAGNNFKQWLDENNNVVSIDSTYSFHALANKTFKAVFEKIVLQQVSAGLDQSICSGASVTLTASNAANYSWNTGQNTASITVSPTVTTTYIVTANNGTKDSVVVAVKQLPDVSFTKIIEGSNVQFTGPVGNDSYSWNFGDSESSLEQNPSHTYTSNGKKYVTLSAVLNGCTNQKTDSLVINNIMTGISNNAQMDFKIYPNPTTDFITIQLDSYDAYNIEIINDIGQIVWATQNVQKQQTINVQDLAKGTYILILDDGKTITNKRFVVQ